MGSVYAVYLRQKCVAFCVVPRIRTLRVLRPSYIFCSERSVRTLYVYLLSHYFCHHHTCRKLFWKNHRKNQVCGKNLAELRMSTEPRNLPNYLIQNGFNVSNLVSQGSLLEIHSDYQDYDVSVPDNSDPIVVDTLGKPVDVSFTELAKNMKPVDEQGYVKKKIIEEGGGEVIDQDCTVGFAYSAYWEWEKKPFDLKPPSKPMECDLRDSVLLPGLHLAVSSMRVGEVSQFLISYELMYGKLGNPPAIKPASDCVFYVKLVRSLLKPDVRADSSEQNMFERYLKECKKLFMNGSQFFINSNIPMAIRCFNRALNIMHHTRLADENEERTQERFLLKLYLNLATCYNHAKNPRRACCMCNEIHRLQNIWNNGKALYQNAKALRMLGDFAGAEKRLKRAKQLSPEMCKEIEKEIHTVNVQRDAYDQSKIFVDQQEERLQGDGLSEEFKTEMTALVEQFKEDDNICKLALPKTLNSAELKYIQDLSEQFKFTCSIVKKDVSLDKTPVAEESKSD